MMKALTHNIRQEREDQRDRSAQLFMWCIVVSMHQDDGIGASRLLRACNEMDAFEKKYQTAILYGSSKTATDAMRENLKGICDFEVRLPVGRAPRGRREDAGRSSSAWRAIRVQKSRGLLWQPPVTRRSATGETGWRASSRTP